MLVKNETADFFRAIEEEGLAYPEVMYIVDARKKANEVYDPVVCGAKQSQRLMLGDATYQRQFFYYTRLPLCLLNVLIWVAYLYFLFAAPPEGNIGMCRMHYV